MNIIEEISAWVAKADYNTLPAEVIEESKRILLDSIGCAIAGIEDSKGRIGLTMGRHLGGKLDEATIFGTAERASVWGAAFANGELINALDMDHVLPPGHVAPYVLPVIVALAEKHKASGKELIVALALAHELSHRLGKASDYLRDVKDGVLNTPKIYGYSSTIFGAVAGAAKIMGLSEAQIANALGIAGSIAPVNSHMAWVMHFPPTTIKYTHAGNMTNAALTAVYAAAEGHRGDLHMLDDAEYGFARIIGSTRWAKENITKDIMSHWGFVGQSSFKAYPHCHVMHALFGAQDTILEEEDIKPAEIDKIKIWIEGFCDRPLWTSTDIRHTADAQFSMRHGMALAAHRIPPGKQWQTAETVYDPSILALMEKVEYEIHPDYVKLLLENAGSRPARVEIHARGQVYVKERRYPKGMRSPEPSSFMTNAELEAKFLYNCEDVMSFTQAGAAAKAIMSLEKQPDVSVLIAKMGAQKEVKKELELS